MVQKAKLTPQRIRNFPHPEPRKKAFLWDTVCQGLAVVATSKRKNFVFETRFNKKTLRMTIGLVDLWTVEDARKRATELRQLVDQGIDPRLEQTRRKKQEEAAREEAQRENVIVDTAWTAYLEDRKPHWSDRTYQDHIRVSHRGGEPKKRGKGMTIPGALAPLIDKHLSEVTPKLVSSWIKEEAPQRGTQVSLAFRLLRAFLNWCEDQPRYKGLAAPDACTSRQLKDLIPKKKAKTDCLQKEQLPAWFTSVDNIGNPVIRVYLQVVLLTGARREEVLSLQWGDIDFHWKTIVIKDKVEGERTIPLTPYIMILLRSLPHRNEWVFSSPISSSGRLQEPRKAYQKALELAGIEGLTIHGLRRSFATLSEWVELPTGIVYQIQGHKPSATAEKHYRQRPIDLLRRWHIKLEGWILEQAGIEQPTEEKASKIYLRHVG